MHRDEITIGWPRRGEGDWMIGTTAPAMVALLTEPCGADDAAVKELMSGNICRCGAQLAHAIPELRAERTPPTLPRDYMALFEQTHYDPQNGAPINSNLADYIVSTNADVPPIEVHFLDYPDKRSTS